MQLPLLLGSWGIPGTCLMLSFSSNLYFPICYWAASWTVVHTCLAKEQNVMETWIIGSQSLRLQFFLIFRRLFFSPSVLLLLFIRTLLPESREKQREPILGQANCSSGQPGWGPHHGQAAVCCRQLYLGLQSAPARLLSRHRGQKSISNKLHFPELLRRRR